MIPVDEVFRHRGRVAGSLMALSLPQIVAQRIQQAILAAGYKSQDQFAHEIGMSRGTLSRVLSSSVDVRLSTIHKIAEGLGIPAYKLLMEEVEHGSLNAGDTGKLKKRGRPKQADIAVRILIPDGVEPPAWLKNACKLGSLETKPEK